MHKLGNYKIEFTHVFDRLGNKLEIAQVFTKTNKRLSVGRTVISSKNLNVSKDFGRRVALKEAFSKTKEISREQRIKVWEDYRTKMTKTPRW